MHIVFPSKHAFQAIMVILTLVISQIYSYTIFAFIFKFLKWFYRLLTGTTELYRICDAVVVAQNLNTLETLPESSTVPPVVLAKDLSKRVQVNVELLARVEACLLYSSKLGLVRRKLESRPEIANLEESLNDILRMKRFPHQGNILTPQALVLRACVTRIFRTFQLMHELNSRAQTRYDASVPINEKRLIELWTALVPDEPLGTRYTSQWQKIGFQGKDPATDFRAMGLLGLDDLHYFASTHPDVAKRVLGASHHTESWFSFAIVGINITAYALRLVRTRHLQRHFYTYGATKEVYHEFYCYLFDEFEKFWTSQKTPPSVLQFNDLFKTLQHRIERQLLEQQVCVLDENRVNRKTE